MPGPLDPDGTEPPPPLPPPDDDADLPPGQLIRDTIVVRPGDSIQAAIDRAEPGTRIFIQAGVYREVQNPTNWESSPRAREAPLTRVVAQPVNPSAPEEPGPDGVQPSSSSR